jgi:hypothetical protein
VWIARGIVRVCYAVLTKSDHLVSSCKLFELIPVRPAPVTRASQTTPKPPTLLIIDSIKSQSVRLFTSTQEICDLWTIAGAVAHAYMPGRGANPDGLELHSDCALAFGRQHRGAGRSSNRKVTGSRDLDAVQCHRLVIL